MRRDTACIPADMPCRAHATAMQACAQSSTPRQACCIASQRAKTRTAERARCLVNKRRRGVSVVSPCRCIARGFPHICDASASRGAPHTSGAKVRCSGDIVRTFASYCSLIFAAVAGGERTAHWAGLAQFLRKEIGADSAPSFGSDSEAKNQSDTIKTIARI